MKILPKKRRLENKTDYLKRRKLLRGNKPRVIIRKSNKYIIIQYCESIFAQDQIKFSLTSKELLNNSWPKELEGSLKSLPAGYLTGFLFGKKIKNSREAILDTGLIRKTAGSKIQATLKGIVDSGFKIKCNNEFLPKEIKLNNEKVEKIFNNVKEAISKLK